MSKYYYHGVNEFSDFIKILKEGEIKSPRLQGYTYETDFWRLGLNGLDYICLCNKLQNYNSLMDNSTFERFIFNQYCFIVSDDIEVKKAKTIDMIDYDEYISSKLEILKNIDKGIHVSLFIDEYRIKDRIEMNKIVGIGIPFELLYRQDLITLRQVISLAQSLGLDIVDSGDIDFVEKYESSKYNKDEIDKKIKEFSLW